LAGDERGLFRTKKGDRIGNILGCADALHGGVQQHLVLHRSRLVNARGGHGGFDQARGNGIYANAGRAEFRRHLPGQAVQGRLGGGIGRRVGRADQAKDRRHVQYGAAVAVLHDAGGQAAHAEDGGHVDV
jgi:hypothetical protein